MRVWNSNESSLDGTWKIAFSMDRCSIARGIVYIDIHPLELYNSNSSNLSWFMVKLINNPCYFLFCNETDSEILTFSWNIFRILFIIRLFCK